MYGIISVAILTGIIGIQIIKEITSKTSKENLEIPIKKMDLLATDWRIVFWFGWALVSSCPGPIHFARRWFWTVLIVYFWAPFWELIYTGYWKINYPIN
jgi:hypothetical protein